MTFQDPLLLTSKKRPNLTRIPPKRHGNATRHRQTFIAKKPRIPPPMKITNDSPQDIGSLSNVEMKMYITEKQREERQRQVIRQRLEEQLMFRRKGAKISRYWKRKEVPSMNAIERDRDSDFIDASVHGTSISMSTNQTCNNIATQQDNNEIFKPRRDPLDRKNIFVTVPHPVSNMMQPLHGYSSNSVLPSHTSHKSNDRLCRSKSIPLSVIKSAASAWHRADSSMSDINEMSTMGHQSSTMNQFHGFDTGSNGKRYPFKRSTSRNQSQSALFSDNPKVSDGKRKSLPSQTITHEEEELENYLNQNQGFIHDTLQFPNEVSDELSRVTVATHMSSHESHRNNDSHSHLFNTAFDIDEMNESQDNDSFDFGKVDEFIREVPYERTNAVSTLAESLCNRFGSDMEKIRAIFTWICTNIEHVSDQFYQDYTRVYKTAESDANMTSKVVLDTRHATVEGYAQLFFELCRAGEIPCEIVVGWAKGVDYEVGDPLFSLKPNHMWNVVEADGQFCLIDCMWGTGITVNSTFQKSFNPHYFATSPKEFIIDHFPENPRNQMLNPPLSRKYFEEMVYMGPNSFKWGLHPLNSESRRASIVTKGRICFMFSLQKVPKVVSLQLTCKSFVLTNSSKFTTYILKDDRLYIYACFPFKGLYELRVFLKENEHIANSLSHVVSYQIKVLSSLPFDVGFYDYSPTWDSSHHGLFSVLAPAQNEILKYSVIPFKIITSEPVEHVIVAVGCRPDGAFQAGKSYTHKRELREHQRNVFVGTLKINPLVISSGREVVNIMILPKGERMPSDEYGWIKFVAVQYSLVSRYSEFQEDLGKHFVLKSLEEEREDIISQQLDISHLKDMIDQIETDGPLLPQYADLGFKVIMPLRTSVLSVIAGEQFLIQLEIPPNYFISCNFTCFNTYDHPCLLYYDERLHIVSLRGYFGEAGSYVFNLYAKKHGLTAQINFAKFIVKVTGERNFDFKRPTLQSLAYENFLITSEQLRQPQYNTKYRMSMLVHQKRSFKGLQYKSGREISQTVSDHGEDKDLKMWRGEISLEDGDFLRSGRFGKPFLLLDAKMHGIPEMGVPNMASDEDVHVGDPEAHVNVGKHTKLCIVVPKGENSFSMILEVGNPNYNLDAKFVDFTGSTKSLGYFQEQQEQRYSIRCRAKRPQIYKLIVSYRVIEPDMNTKVKNGPQYYLFFDF